MLNAKVCENCLKEHLFRCNFSGGGGDDHDLAIVYNSLIDNHHFRWRITGEVACWSLGQKIDSPTYSINRIPKNCTKKLEQTMAIANQEGNNHVI